MSLAVIILALVTLQRIGELWLSNRNTRRLLDPGLVIHHCDISAVMVKPPDKNPRVIQRSSDRDR